MKSYIKVSSFGSYAEEFMNELLAKNISIWNLENKDGIIYFDANIRDYKKIARTGIFHRMKTKVESRQGAYFKLRPYKNRYGIIFGVVSFAAVIILFSNFVWDVKVSGNEKLTSAQIIELLEKQGIGSGTYIRGYDKERAELSMRLELEELAWVSIEREGSRINVKVSERVEPIAPVIPPDIPCNVVAAKSGLIVETEVYRGSLIIEKGSGVNQGDVIVSGVVGDGAGGVLLNHASAKIIAECEDTAEFFISYTSLERKKNDRITKNNSIIIFGKSFPLFIKPKAYEQASYSEETRAPTFFGLRLPYRVKTGIYTHYDMVEVTISQNEAINRLKKQVELYMENFYGESTDSEIVSFEENYTPLEDGLKVEINIVYRTDIASKRAIGVP